MSELTERVLSLLSTCDRGEVLFFRSFESHTPADRWSKTIYYVIKRVTDVILASLLLVILAPLLVVIAGLIKMDSPGPVLFRQHRVRSRRRIRNGVSIWEGRTFLAYKFRSMFCDANESAHRDYIRDFCRGAICVDDGGVSFKLKGDPRITRIGRILRKSSLDELPQLINVLKGEMSLVGPRPVPPYEVAHYDLSHYGRFAATPGITGLWQVRGRGRVPFEEMIRMDIEYTQRCSLWFDVKILILTIPAVFSLRGAR